MPSTPLNRCAIVNLAIHGTSARQKSDEPSSIGQAANRHVVNEEALSRLLTLDIGELRQQWRGLYKTQAPRHLSRELLVRAVAFRMQELARGGLRPEPQRQLRRIAQQFKDTGNATKRARAELKPGTRLMREWQRRTYDVLVLDDGFSWQGTRYRSLSAIARKITGTAWSGPLFFGLKPNRSTPRPSSPILGPSDAPMAGSNAIRTEKHQERGRDLGGGRRRRSLRAFVARRQTSIWYRDLAAGGPATLQFAGRRLAVLGARRVSAMVVPDRAAPILCEDWKVGPSHYLNQDLGTVWLDQ